MRLIDRNLTPTAFDDQISAVAPEFRSGRTEGGYRSLPPLLVRRQGAAPDPGRTGAG